MLLEGRPFASALVLAACVLTLLFVALDPGASAGLPPVLAAIYWFAHIGIGLALCVLAAILLNRTGLLDGSPGVLAILASGLLGSLLFAPIALALEQVMPQSPTGVPDGWLDQWELAGGVRAVVAEWLNLAPEFVTAWLLLNAPPLLRRRALEDIGATAVAEPAAAPGPPPAEAEGPDPAAVNGFLDRLPPAIGRDFIAISADLHYLNVVTRRGRATVLGTLDDAERALDGEALRIHRSHLVARGGVRRVLRKGNQWFVETVTAQKLPVSRRRVALVRERLGSDFVISTETPREPASRNTA